MRSDLGRLAAIAEILQIRQSLAHPDGGCFRSRHGLRAWRRNPHGGILPGKSREYPMRVFRIAAVFALLVSPAYAQAPRFSLGGDAPVKTQEELDAEAAKEKAYKDSLRKIPDAKPAADPWGNVRSDAPKDASKSAAPAKPRTKTRSTTN
jgi:hypothetical protein